MSTPTSTSPKKHKKHKHKEHKKHKKRRHHDLDPISGLTSPEDDMRPQLKLKIKIGGTTLSTKNVSITSPTDLHTPKLHRSKSHRGSSPESFVPRQKRLKLELEKPQKAKKIKPQIIIPADDDDDEELTDPMDEENDPKQIKTASDEEEEWLDALEEGRLEEYEQAKQNSKKMTARQRSLLEKNKEKNTKDEELFMLPLSVSKSKPEKVVTEEMMQRRTLKAKKRAEMAALKKEKDKKQTIDRLLKKQDYKSKGTPGKHGRGRKVEIPRISYVSTQNGFVINLPASVPFPLEKQGSISAPKQRIQCGMDGCENLKKYSCSKTGIPLCSLQCYKKNQNRPKRMTTSEIDTVS